jgi:hypothetical protein
LKEHPKTKELTLEAYEETKLTPSKETGDPRPP